MEPIKDIVALLLHHIQNLYSAEKQQLPALQMIIERAKNGSLKKALHHHTKLTEEQVKRLEKLPQLIKGEIDTATNVRTSVVPLSTEYVCKGMKGLIDEATEILNGELGEDVSDAAIIACVQKMEHYEITTYGTAHAYALELNLTKVEALLKETLDEEYDADNLLTALATTSLNKKAEPEDLKIANEAAAVSDEEPTTEVYTSGNNAHDEEEGESTRNIQSPGGRAGTSHRRYTSGESRGH
jgi:ferritin-like metal-binding protein YciE